MELGSFNVFNLRPGFGMVIGDKIRNVTEVTRDTHNIPVSYKVASGDETIEIGPEDVIRSGALVVVPPEYYRSHYPTLHNPVYFDAVAKRNDRLSKIPSGELVGQPFSSSQNTDLFQTGYLEEPTENLVFGPYIDHTFLSDNGTVHMQTAGLFEASKGTRYGVKKLSGPLGEEQSFGLVARRVPCNVYKNEITSGIAAEHDFITGGAVLDYLYQMGFTSEELSVAGVIR